MADDPRPSLGNLKARSLMHRKSSMGSPCLGHGSAGPEPLAQIDAVHAPRVRDMNAIS